IGIFLYPDQRVRLRADVAVAQRIVVVAADRSHAIAVSLHHDAADRLTERAVAIGLPQIPHGRIWGARREPVENAVPAWMFESLVPRRAGTMPRASRKRMGRRRDSASARPLSRRSGAFARGRARALR